MLICKALVAGSW